MSEVAADLSFKPPNRAAERPHFWRRVAERLDALAAYSTKHAVSEEELRRVDEDIKRCRQLLLRNPQRRRDARPGRTAMPNVDRAIIAG